MDDMTIKSFRKWIRRIYDTQEEELDCEAFAKVIPQYVDAEVAGGEADLRFPRVKYHLAQCLECNDLYQTLRDVAQIEYAETASELAKVEQHTVTAEPLSLERS